MSCLWKLCDSSMRNMKNVTKDRPTTKLHCVKIQPPSSSYNVDHEVSNVDPGPANCIRTSSGSPGAEIQQVHLASHVKATLRNSARLCEHRYMGTPETMSIFSRSGFSHYASKRARPDRPREPTQGRGGGASLTRTTVAGMPGLSWILCGQLLPLIAGPASDHNKRTRRITLTQIAPQTDCFLKRTRVDRVSLTVVLAWGTCREDLRVWFVTSSGVTSRLRGLAVSTRRPLRSDDVALLARHAGRLAAAVGRRLGEGEGGGWRRDAPRHGTADVRAAFTRAAGQPRAQALGEQASDLVLPHEDEEDEDALQRVADVGDVPEVLRPAHDERDHLHPPVHAHHHEQLQVQHEPATDIKHHHHQVPLWAVRGGRNKKIIIISGRGGVVVRLLVSNLGEPGLIPSEACENRARSVLTAACSPRHRVGDSPLPSALPSPSSAAGCAVPSGRTGSLTEVKRVTKYRRFASGNRAGRCRWSAGFLGDLPFPPSLHSGAAPFSPHFTLIDSQDLVKFNTLHCASLNPLYLSYLESCRPTDPRLKSEHRDNHTACRPHAAANILHADGDESMSVYIELAYSDLHSGGNPKDCRTRNEVEDSTKIAIREWTIEHRTPVQSLALSGDGALDACGSVALIAPAFLGLEDGKKPPGRSGCLNLTKFDGTALLMWLMHKIGRIYSGFGGRAVIKGVSSTIVPPTYSQERAEESQGFKHYLRKMLQFPCKYMYLLVNQQRSWPIFGDTTCAGIPGSRSISRHTSSSNMELPQAASGAARCLREWINAPWKCFHCLAREVHSNVFTTAVCSAGESQLLARSLEVFCPCFFATSIRASFCSRSTDLGEASYALFCAQRSKFACPSTKLNGNRYKTLLGDHLQPFMNFSFPDNYGMFQQDNAPSHRAADVQDWFEEHSGEF
ncbi:hypothetical protein PR048_018084 [Dryococelus australis]|uniref:Uncharacterized protein n=1 Tax=Dryococelus australis TaxID=614101 RepID=A0ABQ9HBD7_9NEOP|nr:hypothetical protein PR048_018084 [Dryococelus australis]